MAASLKDLMNAPLRPGRLAWIGLRPARRAPSLFHQPLQGLLQVGHDLGMARGQVLALRQVAPSDPV